MAEVNYMFSVVQNGKVIERLFGNSLSVIAIIRKKFSGCEIEAFDVSEYGLTFSESPCIIADGSFHFRVRCIETGYVWKTTKECAQEIGVPLKTLYTSISRGSALKGKHYEKLTK